jgi:hypothetical protein
MDRMKIKKPSWNKTRNNVTESGLLSCDNMYSDWQTLTLQTNMPPPPSGLKYVRWGNGWPHRQAGLTWAPLLTPFLATCLHNQMDSTFYMLQLWRWRQNPPTRLYSVTTQNVIVRTNHGLTQYRKWQKIKKVVSNWCCREMREEYSWKYNLALQRNSSWALDSTCTVKQSEHLDPFLCG